MPIISAMLKGGMQEVFNYLSAHVITCLVPALALLLAGPAVSIPNLLVINRVMGFKRTAAYFMLVVVMATLTGWLYGQYFI